MSYIHSLRHFPIVKVIPLTELDAEKERLGERAFAGMVANAIVSLQDVESLWSVDHDSTGLKEKFQKLYYQLDSMKKYCESDRESSLSI
jgi:hypothetical protein